MSDQPRAEGYGSVARAVASRNRVVHRALVVGKRRNTWPACGLSRRRWPSMEITTTLDQTKVTCRRKGCS